MDINIVKVKIIIKIVIIIHTIAIITDLLTTTLLIKIMWERLVVTQTTTTIQLTNMQVLPTLMAMVDSETMAMLTTIVLIIQMQEEVLADQVQLREDIRIATIDWPQQLTTKMMTSKETMSTIMTVTTLMLREIFRMSRSTLMIMWESDQLIQFLVDVWFLWKWEWIQLICTFKIISL